MVSSVTVSGKPDDAWAPLPILLSATFCALVGLAFGVYPARQAARLDPIAALRHE